MIEDKCMNTLISPRRSLTAGLAAAAIAFGGVAAAALSPASATSPQQPCPASGLVYVCGKYNTEAECTQALNARNGLIDGREAWCWPPSGSHNQWELVAPLA
ncbi:hypothetical protein AXK56_16300 [Tsukamurella pulmonis]|nr:hypothetical protein AXK56_16300 [Tsukamurella pulmonis]